MSIFSKRIFIFLIFLFNLLLPSSVNASDATILQITPKDDGSGLNVIVRFGVLPRSRDILAITSFSIDGLKQDNVLNSFNYNREYNENLVTGVYLTENKPFFIIGKVINRNSDGGMISMTLPPLNLIEENSRSYYKFSFHSESNDKVLNLLANESSAVRLVPIKKFVLTLPDPFKPHIQDEWTKGWKENSLSEFFWNTQNQSGGPIIASITKTSKADQILSKCVEYFVAFIVGIVAGSIFVAYLQKNDNFMLRLLLRFGIPLLFVLIGSVIIVLDSGSLYGPKIIFGSFGYLFAVFVPGLSEEVKKITIPGR